MVNVWSFVLCSSSVPERFASRHRYPTVGSREEVSRSVLRCWYIFNLPVVAELEVALTGLRQSDLDIYLPPFVLVFLLLA